MTSMGPGTVEVIGVMSAVAGAGVGASGRALGYSLDASVGAAVFAFASSLVVGVAVLWAFETAESGD